MPDGPGHSLATRSDDLAPLLAMEEMERAFSMEREGIAVSQTTIDRGLERLAAVLPEFEAQAGPVGGGS